MPLQASDGTVSNPSITTSGDTNTGIYFPAADTIGLVEGGTEVVRINSSGNVGVGTTSPTSTLTVSGTTSISGNTSITSSTASTSTTSGALVVTGGLGVGGALFAAGTATAGKFSPTANTVTGNGLYLPDVNTLAFSTNSVERVRITSTGNVGINPTVPSTLTAPLNVRRLSSDAAIHIQGELGATGTSNQQGPGITFQNITSASANGLGIAAISYGTSSNNDRGYLAFSTSETSNAPLERLRISSTGNVGIGTTSPASLLHVNGTIRYTNRPAAGTITPIGFDVNGDLRASSSSLRYKHDVEELEKGLNEVMQLRPVSFKFNGETRTNMGFIAEEIDELGLSDVMLYDEENQPEGVLYANMVSLLTKAIQEQQAQIEELKSEINLLKGIES